jgi:hypothetical protein
MDDPVGLQNVEGEEGCPAEDEHDDDDTQHSDGLERQGAVFKQDYGS